MNGDAPIGIEDQIMLDTGKREIAAKLAAVIDRGCAWRQDFDDDDGIVDGDGLVRTTRTADD
jgi:hypothetical protein